MLPIREICTAWWNYSGLEDAQLEQALKKLERALGML